ncbi:hypothetical protein M3Y97_00325800 [Aphelenchoides bicaudatus]|nr:hypothetical protein M3Y97_00325800 [Aphelenchoides bicaudatus]
MKRNGWFSTTKYKILPTCGTDKKDESTDKPILCTLPETKTRDGLRPEIQGLRAIAIVSVLCFHIFFVISGYLMIMIMLGRKDNLTLSGTATFYFRRIKRIVPIYVFVIALTLISCYLLISDFEFGQVATEAVPSLLFYSNFPFVHKTSYFDLKSRYQFFLHTWSLSCELQFYLFVPLLMLIIGILTNIHFCLTLLFIFTLSIASFYRQVISTSNAKHMTLDARVWQFLFGFFAHFVYQSNFLDWTSKPNQSTCCRLFCWLRNKTPTILLILLLLFPITNLMEGQLQRLLVVFLTALIIAIKQNDSILSSDMLVNLGDVSYSVYLIHWPIFIMHRRLDSDSYDNGKDANHIGCVIKQQSGWLEANQRHFDVVQNSKERNSVFK